LDTCTVETGLLSKKPCGHAAVTHCMNCEQALCAKHALPELTDAGKKTGKFLCKECEAARREIAKNSAPVVAKKPAEPAKPAAAAKEAPPKEAPAAPKPADDGGALEFTPSKDKDKT
jgi:sRNA-binding protein